MKWSIRCWYTIKPNKPNQTKEIATGFNPGFPMISESPLAAVPLFKLVSAAIILAISSFLVLHGFLLVSYLTATHTVINGRAIWRVRRLYIKNDMITEIFPKTTLGSMNRLTFGWNEFRKVPYFPLVHLARFGTKNEMTNKITGHIHLYNE